MAFEGEDARRWALVDAPTQMPAVDWITKSPNGPFIDTGIKVVPEMRGHVYLSVETIKEMAEIAGLLESKNAKESNLYDLEIYNRGYKDGLNEGVELLGKLTTVANRLSPAFSDAIATSVEAAIELTSNAGDESGVSDSDPVDVQVAPVRKRK